jgi:hypothetical protein
MDSTASGPGRAHMFCSFIPSTILTCTYICPSAGGRQPAAVAQGISKPYTAFLAPTKENND